MTTAIYARVSTDDQTTLTQLERLRPRAPGAQEFVDQAVSGRAEKRPEFDRLVAAMRAGTITEVYATRLDRIARTAVAIREFFQEADGLGVRVVLLDTQVDTSNAIGRFLLGLLAEVAELEVAQTVERSKDRQRSIRDQHDRTGEWATRSGRPPFRPRRINPELLNLIVSLRLAGYTWNEVALRAHVPASSARKWASGVTQGTRASRAERPRVIKGG